MTAAFTGIIGRFVLASAGFGARLQEVAPEQWDWPTPCAEWNVRQLVNHMTRGNISYVRLLAGGSSAAFVRLRDADALGADPVAAYRRSVADCTDAFAGHGALRQVLDYPLGRVTGAQALAVRTADSVIHTWDLARAIGAGDRLEPGLVAWMDGHLDEIYAGLAEAPGPAAATRRFFGEPGVPPPAGAARQDLLLHWLGRQPGWAPAR